MTARGEPMSGVGGSGAGAQRWLPRRPIGLALVLAALVAAAVTFLVLTGLTPIEPSGEVVSVAMSVNAALVVALVAAIAVEVRKLWMARRSRRAGAELHLRILALFSFIAIAPAILVSVLAGITLNRGLDRWFEDRTRGIVGNAVAVADAYVQEHARVLRADVIALAKDIDGQHDLYEYEPLRFESFLQEQADLRQVQAVFLLDRDDNVVTRAVLDDGVGDVRAPMAAITGAENSAGPVMIAPGTTAQVGGVMKLANYDDIYVFATRAMDPRVVEYVRLAKEGANEFQALEASRTGVEVAFALVYVGLCLVLLLAALWVGFGFANSLVAPIRRLITAADQIAHGDLNAFVATDRRDGDLASLGESFNTMATQLRSQRDELVAATEQVDRRRRFTEAVLAGVTAGVVGVDANGSIALANQSAQAILDADEGDLVGRPLTTVVPELAPILRQAREAGERPRLDFRLGQIRILRRGQERILMARITADRRPSAGRNDLVVTLDDITDLVTAQRATAWGDVARRIAHEIKNPLTPIQLSVERLRRRYGKRVEDDRAVFDQCVDTIIRHVGNIGRMVDEFSAFARMPKPTPEAGDLVETVREAMFLQSVGHPEVDLVAELPREPQVGLFDHRLIGQAVTNVVKNAFEAVLAVPAEERGRGRVEVSLARRGDEFVIDVVDNGIGMPKEHRERLLEPYITTREKGTGLGLSIVSKIAEEHGGRIELLDAPAVAVGGRGACVRLVLRSAEAA